MHLFLYQAARHTAPTSPYGRNNRTRYVQSTIRGDFDLELLKRGIKGRYKILPHGEHDFQKMLRQIDLEDEFYGHIVQIEEKRNAVWFKLNYDQVGKNITKYIGGWQDLNPDDLSSVITEYQVYKTHKAIVQSHLNQCRYQHSQTERFKQQITAKPLPCIDGVASEMQKSIDVLGKAFSDLTNENAHVQNKMVACQQVVKDYLKERQL